MTPCRRKDVESGKVRIVRAGDGTLHPIEACYLRPEVHSLMQVDRPVIRACDLDRVVLWVSQPLAELRSTYVAKYIRWGAKQTFPSKKSKPVPVPKRSSCVSRPLWYDLTGPTEAAAFWPMTQKYRHVIPCNPDGLVCNHRLFYVSARGLRLREARILPAILNCTLVGLFKHFYGRYAGSEGTLDTEVIDCLLMGVPDPRGIGEPLGRRIASVWANMQEARVGHLVEQSMLNCHSEAHLRAILRRKSGLPAELRREDRRELDDCILNLLGMRRLEDRQSLLDELYSQVAEYYRYLRTQDIQAMENRAGAKVRRFGARDLAESVWDSLSEDERGRPLVEWVRGLPGMFEEVQILDGRPRALGPGHLFDPSAVEFRLGKEATQVSYAHVEQAALVAMLADLDIRGKVRVAQTKTGCREWMRKIQTRLSEARERFETLAGSRTGTQELQQQTTELLMQWFVHGRSDQR